MEKMVSRRTVVCPECGGGSIIHDYNTGEIVCTNCGLVIGEWAMDEGPEWCAFTEEERASKSRVGMPMLYSVHDKGLSTTIDRIGEDAFGRKLPLSTRSQMWRLRKWQFRSRVQSSIDRNLAQTMGELERLSDKLYITSPIKERAAVIYRKALNKGLVRGRSIAAVVAAALYAACRGSGTPRTLKEIEEASLVDKKDVARCYRLLLRELNVQVSMVNPLIYISKIAETVGISGKTQGLAIQIFWKAKRKRVTAGKDPKSLAAAILYIACMLNDEEKSQKEIAGAAGVTEVTLRNRCKALNEQLKLKLPSRGRRHACFSGDPVQP
jgi:transcription initiation factor TFIIB